MALDPVQVAHALDEIRRHYLQAWPPLVDRLKELERAAKRVTSPAVNLVDWTVHYLGAAMRFDDSAATRRKLLAALTAPPLGEKENLDDERFDAVEEGEGAAERDERRARLEREIAASLVGQTAPAALNFDPAGSELLADVPPRSMPRWERAAASVRRDLAPGNATALAAELACARSAAESLDAAGRRLRGLSWPARHDFLGRVGYPVFAPDPPRVAAMERLGWIERAGGAFDGAAPASEGVDARRQRALRAANQIAKITDHAPSQVGLLLGMLTGQIPEAARAGAEGFCFAKPRCAACPAKGVCLYARLLPPDAAPPPAKLPIKHWAPEDQPREKAASLGPERLTDAELLALALRTGAGGLSSLDVAQELLAKFGGLAGIREASPEQIAKTVRGVGRAKAVELKAAFELGMRVASERPRRGLVVAGSRDVHRALGLRYLAVKQEVFQMLALTSKNEVIEHAEITRGTLNASLVHPREAFKRAIELSASAVIFVHNHPSGDPTPSDADHEITATLGRAARLLRIRMLDHVILGRDRYYSFAEGGMRDPSDEAEAKRAKPFGGAAEAAWEEEGA